MEGSSENDKQTILQLDKIITKILLENDDLILNMNTIIFTLLFVGTIQTILGKPIGGFPVCKDPRNPCKCDASVIHLDKAGMVPVMEFACNYDKINKDLIPAGYECEQLTAKTWVGLLNVAINVKSGCELRCTAKSCDGTKGIKGPK